MFVTIIVFLLILSLLVLIHEAGHFLFSLFSGQLLSILGGSITQLAVPLLLLIYFLLVRNKFASGFCLFWFGNNFVNISPYLGDARCQCMDITGTIHDWNFILGQFNILDQDKSLSTLVLVIGLSICFLSLILLITNILKDFMQKMPHR